MKKLKFLLLLLLLAGVMIAAIMYFRTVDVAVLNPKGEIASKQRDLIVFAVLLCSIVVIPVFTMLGLFAWRYRESNQKATYRPDWDGNRLLETIWWGIPCIIILVLAVVTWRTSHELDPYRPLVSSTKPINIQVVALEWKWLFIYPDEQVASVNLVQFPKDTPINFTITADAPMNAFWIPSLGTQVYAMSGMSTKLHLIASETGDYHGSSSNISGKGFANMAFVARASNSSEYQNWINAIKHGANSLDQTSYNELAKPASVKTPMQYNLKDKNLYDTIVMKYMMPPASKQEDDAMKEEMSHGHDHSSMMMSGMEGM